MRKSKLALGEAHTYNPPHRKACFANHCGFGTKLCVFRAGRAGRWATDVLEGPGELAWLCRGSNAVAVFFPKFKERFE